MKQDLYWSADEHGQMTFSDTKLTTSTQYENQLHKQRQQYNALEKSEPFFNILLEFQTNVLKNADYNLTRAEAGILLMLCTYVRHTNHYSEKNYLKENGRFLSNKDLAEILQLSARQVSKYKKQLIEKHALFEDEHGIYIDKKIMTRGTTSERQSYRVFIYPTRELYQTFIIPNKPNSIKNLGLFFALIPFIYKQNNHIVKDEKDFNYSGVYINHDWDSLAELLQTKKADLQRDMKKMNDHYLLKTNEHLVWTEKYELETVSDIDKRKVSAFRFVVNPNITFSSTEDKRIETLQTMQIETTDKVKPIKAKPTFIVGLYHQSGKIYYFYTKEKYNYQTIKRIGTLCKQNKALKFKNKEIFTNEILSISNFKNLEHIKKTGSEIIEIKISDDTKTYKDLVFI